jgi:hypothetical protein
VRAFLADHPDLLDLLVEASETIVRFLPTDGPLALDVIWDPEDEDDEGELFAVVPTFSEPEEVRPRRTRLVEQWLLDAFRRADGRFNVHVEYR